jgi:hypothetical protein
MKEIIIPDMGDGMEIYIGREISRLKALEHPNIVR